MRHKPVVKKCRQSRNECSGLESRRPADQGQCRTVDCRLVHVDSNRCRQYGISELESKDRRPNEETPLSQPESSPIENIPAPDPDLSIPVEVAIMNDLSKRMRDCRMAKEKPAKKRRLHFNPGHLKTIPSAVFRAFRGFVKGNKQPPPVEKPQTNNLSLVCCNEFFHLPFNLVPTEARKDKSLTIICSGLNEAVTFPFYYGNIDRHEAARVLEGLDHGYFLLRDSFHPDFRFAVSFRCADATVHARICYNKGRYTFKMDDSMRFSSHKLLDFIKHYNFVERSMLDEPYLLKPVNRKQPFSLQFLCTASIASRCTPKGVESLPIPDALKTNIIESFAIV